MTAALVPTTMPMQDMMTLAKAIAASGLFGIRTPDQALALMAIAHAEGRHPALAARDYDIIQGKPAKKAEAMMRDFIEAGGKVEWHELSDTEVTATFTHPQTGSVRISWDMERAKIAGLASKDNWKKFPRAMLRSRVVSEGVRTVWPLATSGMFVPEEVADFAKETKEAHPGPTIEASPERQAINDAVPMHPMMPNGPVDPNPVDVSKPRRTPRQFLDALEIALNDAQDADEADRILCSDDVMKAKNVFTGEAKARLDRLVLDSLAKWTWDPEVEPLPEIAGEEKMGA